MLNFWKKNLLEQFMKYLFMKQFIKDLEKSYKI